MSHLKKYMYLLLINLLLPVLSFGQDKDFNILDFGAVESHKEVSTKAIQSAIDTASKVRGRVIIPKGLFLTGTLFLKSNVSIKMESGAELYGSPNLEDYAEVPVATEEPHFSKCLFYARGEKNITILGHPRTEINGQGYFFKFSPERPKLFRIEECQNVRIQDAIIKNSGSWCIYFRECDSIFIHNTRVYNKENRNNDGMNFDGCSNVKITDCNIQVEDDAICLKSSVDKVTENFLISNCTVSSYWASVKFGTASKTGFRNVKVQNCQFFDSRHGTIKLLAVDGAIIEDVEFSDIKMFNCAGPIFLRLGNRGRDYSKSIKQVYEEDVQPEGRPVGKLRNITFRNIEGRITGSIDPPTSGIMLTGLPDQYIENITMENIHLSFEGFGRRNVKDRVVPEDEARYPEQLFFGELPSYGLYARHVKGLRLKNITFELRNVDDRQALVLDDVMASNFENLNLHSQEDSKVAIIAANVKDSQFKNVKLSGNSSGLIEVSGPASENIRILESDPSVLRHKEAIIFSKGASKSAVKVASFK